MKMEGRWTVRGGDKGLREGGGLQGGSRSGKEREERFRGKSCPSAPLLGPVSRDGTPFLTMVAGSRHGGSLGNK